MGKPDARRLKEFNHILIIDYWSPQYCCPPEHSRSFVVEKCLHLSGDGEIFYCTINQHVTSLLFCYYLTFLCGQFTSVYADNCGD